MLDDLVRRAEATVGDRRRTLAFIRAASTALAEGDSERAIAISERIDDLYERKIQTSVVLYQAAMKRLREGKLEGAYTQSVRFRLLFKRG